ncbi:hypothetical protein BD779DRAFT_1675461 [Infundibulicybe gibba]|nr:hypothetical protein BD779DRAFT_1675461 [Infundibulicybe gibba]
MPGSTFQTSSSSATPDTQRIMRIIELATYCGYIIDRTTLVHQSDSRADSCEPQPSGWGIRLTIALNGASDFVPRSPQQTDVAPSSLKMMRAADISLRLDFQTSSLPAATIPPAQLFDPTLHLSGSADNSNSRVRTSLPAAQEALSLRTAAIGKIASGLEIGVPSHLHPHLMMHDASTQPVSFAT